MAAAELAAISGQLLKLTIAINLSTRIITPSETWLDKPISDLDIHLDGYTVFRRD